MSTNYHDDITFSAGVTTANVNLPLGQLDEAITDVLAGDVGFSQLNTGSYTSKTISSGAITGNATNITVDTEASAASDDLDTISGGTAGDVIHLKMANASRVVTLRNNGGGTGNIRTPSTLNFTFSSVNQIAALEYTGSVWILTNESSGAPSDATYIVQSGSSGLSNEQALDTLSPGILQIDGSGVISIATAGTDYNLSQYAVLQDQKANGTDGGSASATTWNARDLNTEVYDPDNIVTVSSNKFVPDSGSYKINVKCPFFETGANRVRLYNVTAASAVLQGVNVTAGASSTAGGVADLDGFFTANGTDEYRIDHYSVAAQATTGLGAAVSTGQVEVYTQVVLEKRS